MSNWYDTGDEAADRVQEEVETRQEENQKDRIYRFWMPPNTDQHITFVDDDTKKHAQGYGYPFLFTEHQLKIGGKWQNWFTCSSGMKDDKGEPIKCPLCESGDQPSHVAAYSVIDHNEWTDKKGKVHVDELKLYVVKSKVLKVVRKISRKKEGLRGLYVEVGRGGSDEPNSGHQFDVERRDKLPDDLLPPDYRKVFAPQPAAKLQSLVGDVKADNQEPVRF